MASSLHKAKRDTELKLRNSALITRAKLSNCRTASCKSTNCFVPEASVWLRMKAAHESCKIACENSCKRRSGLAEYWTTRATQQPGSALRCAGKLQIRLAR